MSREILEAMGALAREKGISPDKLRHALEDALLSAYKKQPGSAKYARVELDPETADYRVIELIVPERLEAHLIVETIDENTVVDPETGEMVEPQDPEIDPVKFEQYKDQIDERDVTPEDFGRIAAQTAKQVILQRIREAERDMMFEEYRDRDGELITKLFELEVPEIADGLVEIENVAREPGYRSKIAVVSHAQGVDPVGACVGPRGSRVRMVVSELRGEKIDIIPWNTEPARFVAKALSPARVREVYIDDETKESTVIVPEDQLALAIGKEGLNARLAARLTGWKVDIQSEAEFAASEAEAAFSGGEAGEDFSGRCAAILSNGKRCPNASLPGTRFCGIPAHVALAEREASTGVPVAGTIPPPGASEA